MQQSAFQHTHTLTKHCLTLFTSSDCELRTCSSKQKVKKNPNQTMSQFFSDVLFINQNTLFTATNRVHFPTFYNWLSCVSINQNALFECHWWSGWKVSTLKNGRIWVDACVHFMCRRPIWKWCFEDKDALYTEDLTHSYYTNWLTFWILTQE